MPEGFDWKSLLQFLPMAVAGARGGMAGLGGFGEGYSRGAAVREEQEQVRRAQAARDAAEMYAQQRDLVGDQRYEDQQRQAKQAQLMRLIETMPELGERALQDAEAAGVLLPDLMADHAQKSVREWVTLLGQAMPDLGADPALLASAVGDLGSKASRRVLAKIEQLYPRLIEGQDERGIAQMEADPTPRYFGMPFSEVKRLYFQGGNPPTPPSKLNAKQRYEQAVAAGDQAAAAKWLKVIQDESEATRVTVQAPGNEGTWTDTGRVNDKGEAIYINNKTFETRTQPYGQKPRMTGTTNLSPSLQDDIATMKTVEDLISKVIEVGDRTQWSGVGGFGQGSIGEFASKNLGRGTPESVTLRGYIGQIKGTIAKLRGGTSFTPNEQKLLDTYTPGINESPMSIKAKMAGLREFIQMKRKNQLETALGSGAPVSSHGASSVPDGASVVFPDGSVGTWNAALGRAVKTGAK